MYFEDEEIESFQREALIKIRKCLNSVSFYRGFDRKRYRRKDCVVKLALHGQAKCHGLSSILADYLLPSLQ
jgi:hypothetical protein